MVKNSIFISLLIACLFLLWAALFNGFPIVYPDTSTYLSSGFELETPADRPITYGLFILLTSLHGFSLWGVVLLQSFVLAYVIFLLFKYFTACRNPQIFSLIAIIILSFTSGLPWVSGMLLPDVFTPISFISLFLLFFSSKLTIGERIAVYVIFIVANAMHMSHLLINVLLICSFLFITNITFLKKHLPVIRTGKLILFLCITFSGIIIMSSAMSKSKHIFYMGHMVENGILKKFLDENCASQNYKLCAYKDSLPASADRFLWDYKNSPIYKMGGWKECDAEFNSIIGKTFTKPEYIKLHIQASLSGTKNQLTTFNIGEGNVSFGKETMLYQRIEKFIPGNIESYAHCKQTESKLTLFSIFDWPYKIAVYFSLIVLIFLLVLKQLRNRTTAEQRLLIVFTFLGIIYNDFVCATLSTVANRFSCRIMWLLPLLLLMIIFSNLSGSQKNKL